MAYMAIPMPSGGKRGSVVHIERFLGCDFRSGNMLDDIRRSPDAVNMDFGDEIYTPVKRTGYTRVASQPLPGRINGFHRLVKNNEEIRLVHAGTGLHRLNGTQTQLVYSSMANNWSWSFTMGGKLYLLDGRTYMVFDGSSVVPAANNAFVPLTAVIGKPFQAANKLTPKRRNAFAGNGTQKEFTLDSTALDAAAISATVGGVTYNEGSGVTVNRSTGVVTFTAAPANSNGEANIEVFFSKTISGSLDAVNKCRFAGLFGGKNDTRVFLAGNPDTPNIDYQSGLYDPTYFPETGYTNIGADTSPIMGYVKQFNTMVVLKAGNEQDSTQFLRTFELDADGLASFPLDQGAAGVGCISSRSLALLEDEPLFLSGQGIYAVSGTQVDSQRSLQKRSVFVDRKLSAENSPENAIGIVCSGKYYLFVNGNVYVADSRHRHSVGAEGIQYEWHYWTGIPATAAAAWGNQIWFGSADGGVFRFFTSSDGVERYNDDGVPVECRWSTPLLGTVATGGDWSRQKSAPKITVVLQPFMRSGTDVYVAPNGDNKKLLISTSRDILDFSKIDFTRFTFFCSSKPQTIMLKNLARRFETIQLSLENARNEAMGLISLQVQLVSGGEIKGG